MIVVDEARQRTNPNFLCEETYTSPDLSMHLLLRSHLFEEKCS